MNSIKPDVSKRYFGPSRIGQKRKQKRKQEQKQKQERKQTQKQKQKQKAKAEARLGSDALDRRSAPLPTVLFTLLRAYS